MEWYEILIYVVGGLGGLAGIGAFIKIFLFLKQDKKSKDIENEGKKVENEEKKVENQHNVVQDYQMLLNWLQDYIKEYKHEVDNKVAEVKIEVVGMRNEIDALKRVSSEAYRCSYPPTLEDCPVIKAMKASKQCEECRKKGADDCIECKEE